MIASVFPRTLPRNLRFALVFCAAGLCGACTSLETFGLASDRAPTASAARSGDKVAESEKIVRKPMSAEDLDCPTVEVQDAAASLRVGGEENASVRYQFDIEQTARQCDPQGDQFRLKVGVSGHLKIGPAGSPGAYSAPLQITVRRGTDEKPAYSKTYKVEANTAGGAEAAFDLVSEPIVLPLTRTDLADDYAIVVGFDTGHAAEVKRPHKPRHAQASDAH
ncbi:MAG: hypothetical protein ACLPSW_24070 [Roseiarcus sp.]